MSSKNKKNKEKNCYSDHGMALKQKSTKLKRLLYFNASKRQELKKINDWEWKLINLTKVLIIPKQIYLNLEHLLYGA